MNGSFSRSHTTAFLTVLLAGLALPTVGLACLWDHDTLKMERSRFPDTLELITGKFLRHTPEFYAWRIEDRLKRLETYPGNVQLLDDLAVAYDKTGQHEQAIATALATEAKFPGRYETAANLGTFYIHAGRPTEGLPYIERALQINPEAHFGREKYQKLLVEYVLEQRRDDPTRLPLRDIDDSTQTFGAFLAERRSRHEPEQANQPLSKEEVAAAIKGIQGMMRFGHYDSPILLEVLGSLLVERKYHSYFDAKQLATRAYLKASYEVPEGPARDAYRALARRSLNMQTSGSNYSSTVPLETVEADFKRELHDAETWYTELRDRELSWIQNGQDPEGEFDRLYGTTEPTSISTDRTSTRNGFQDIIIGALFAGAVLLLLITLLFIFLVYVVYRRIRRRLRGV